METERTERSGGVRKQKRLPWVYDLFRQRRISGGHLEGGVKAAIDARPLGDHVYVVRVADWLGLPWSPLLYRTGPKGN